jgi:signal transduction histidine kinase
VPPSKRAKRTAGAAPPSGAKHSPVDPDPSWSRDLEALVASLLATVDTEATLRGVASFVARHLGAHRCSVILIRSELGVGHIVTSLEDATIRNLRIRLDAYPEVLAAVERRAPVCVGRGDGSELARALEPMFAERHVQSVMVSPLIVRGEVIGAFFLRTPEGGPRLRPEHLERLRPLLQVTAVALDEALRRGHLRGLGPESDALASMRRLVSGLRHFLNNPLTAVVGFTDLLLRDRSLPASARADVEQIRTAAARSRAVMESVAEFAQGSATGRAAVDLSQVVRAVLREEAEPCREAGIELGVELASDLPMAWGSSLLLTQALARLVANARQSVAGRDGPRHVWVSADSTGSTVRLTVRDDGPGLPAEARDHLFEPFFTTHRSPDRMGLGLAIAHGIVEVHGGTLYLDVGDATHTAFVIELPITIRGESLGAAPGSSAPIPEPPARQR